MADVEQQGIAPDELVGSLPPSELRELVAREPRFRAMVRQLILSGGSPQRESFEQLSRLRDLNLAIAAKPEGGDSIAAFLDIDGTVISGSIIQQLTRQASSEGYGKLSHVIQFVLCFLLYKLDLIPRVKMYRWGYAPCVGRSLGEIQSFVDRCLEKRILRKVHLEARAAIADHRAWGHRCVAVTGAPDYAAAELCAALGFDDVLATPTRFTENGLVDPEVQEPVCFGDGKVPYLWAYAARHQVDLRRSYFYTDSFSDLPVLQQVGEPRVVNAQWLLLPTAIKRRWQRLRWKLLPPRA